MSGLNLNCSIEQRRHQNRRSLERNFDSKINTNDMIQGMINTSSASTNDSVSESLEYSSIKSTICMLLLRFSDNQKSRSYEKKVRGWIKNITFPADAYEK